MHLFSAARQTERERERERERAGAPDAAAAVAAAVMTSRMSSVGRHFRRHARRSDGRRRGVSNGQSGRFQRPAALMRSAASQVQRRTTTRPASAGQDVERGQNEFVTATIASTNWNHYVPNIRTVRNADVVDVDVLLGNRRKT